MAQELTIEEAIVGLRGFAEVIGTDALEPAEIPTASRGAARAVTVIRAAVQAARAAFDQARISALRDEITLAALFGGLADPAGIAGPEIAALITDFAAAVPPEETFKGNYAAYLIQGLASPSETVQAVALDVLCQASSRPNAASLLAQSHELIIPALSLLSSVSPVLTAGASAIFRQVAQSPSGAQLFSDPISPVLRRIAARSIALRLRIYELCADASTLQPALVDPIVACDFILSVDDLDDADPLLLMSVLEVCGQMAASPLWNSLVSRGVITRILTFLELSDADMLEVLVAQRALQFFVHAPPGALTELSSSPRIASAATDYLKSGIDDLMEAAVSFIGHVGASSAQGLAWVRDAALLDGISKLAGDTRCQGLLRSLVYSAVGELLHGAREHANEASEAAVHVLIDALAVAGVDRRPFCSRLIGEREEEVRMAAYRLLQALAGFAWGRTMMVNTANFFTHLLDRSRESSKDGRENQFAVVYAIFSGSNAEARAMPADLYAAGKKFAGEGPHFVQAASKPIVADAIR